MGWGSKPLIGANGECLRTSDMKRGETIVLPLAHAHGVNIATSYKREH